jgi:hypothetical protein
MLVATRVLIMLKFNWEFLPRFVLDSCDNSWQYLNGKLVTELGSSHRRKREVLLLTSPQMLQGILVFKKNKENAPSKTVLELYVAWQEKMFLLKQKILPL